MLGLWLENQQLRLRHDIPLPQPSAEEALVKVRLAGICATDLHLCQGYYPFRGILGHEFVGEIVTPRARAGERVVGAINLGCGHCETCRQAMPEHCPQRRVLGINNYHGAFAEYLVLPQNLLYCVPEHLPDTQAVFTEPLAAALQIAQQVQLVPNRRVLVIGAGKLGQLIARVLRLSACELWVCARYPAQQRLLAQANIAWCSEPESKSWDLVIEATGSPQGLQQALNCAKPRATVVVKSTFSGTVAVPLAQVVVDEIRIQGSRCGPFPPALRLLAESLVDVAPLIAQVFPLTQALEAFDLAATPGTGKILMTF